MLLSSFCCVHARSCSCLCKVSTKVSGTHLIFETCLFLHLPKQSFLVGFHTSLNALAGKLHLHIFLAKIAPLSMAHFCVICLDSISPADSNALICCIATLSHVLNLSVNHKNVHCLNTQSRPLDHACCTFAI